MDNTKLTTKLAQMEQYKKDRIVKLWGWKMTIEQIHGRTGHSPNLIKLCLLESGVWEDRRKGGKGKKEPKPPAENYRHSEIYSR